MGTGRVSLRRMSPWISPGSRLSTQTTCRPVAPVGEDIGVELGVAPDRGRIPRAERRLQVAEVGAGRANGRKIRERTEALTRAGRERRASQCAGRGGR